MDFTLTEEQQMLQDTVRRFAAKEYPFEKHRAQIRAGEGWSREVWRQMAELGLLALPLPEAHGGMNGGAVETMIVMEGLARALPLEPYLTTIVTAAGLLRNIGDAAHAAALLPGIAEGRSIVVFAHFEPGMRYREERVSTRASATGEGWVLDGHKAVVLHGASADQLIISARTAGDVGAAEGISLFLLDPRAPGLSIRPYTTHDGMPAAEISLESVAVGGSALIGPAGGALAAIRQTLDQTRAALAAEAVGLIDALNEATLDYLKTRKQFGQPLGRFQALQHRMVDMYIHAAEARSMMLLAVLRSESADAGERQRAVAAAKAYIGQASRFVGQQAIQLHGGIGVTDELIVSHWFKRLTTIDLTLGDADHHLGRFSDLLLTELAEGSDA